MVTGADLQGRVAPFTRHAITTPPHVADAIGLVVKSHRAEVLPTSVVLRVGEPVAVVVAKDRYQAEDAAELVDVQYDSLPVVTDPEAALAGDAPVLHPELGDNLHSRFRVQVGDRAQRGRQSERAARAQREPAPDQFHRNDLREDLVRGWIASAPHDRDRTGEDQVDVHQRVEVEIDSDQRCGPLDLVRPRRTSVDPIGSVHRQRAIRARFKLVLACRRP